MPVYYNRRNLKLSTRLYSCLLYTSLQTDRSFSVFQFGNETPMFMLFFQYLAASFKVCVETGHPFPEVVHRLSHYLRLSLSHQNFLFYSPNTYTTLLIDEPDEHVGRGEVAVVGRDAAEVVNHGGHLPVNNR